MPPHWVGLTWDVGFLSGVRYKFKCYWLHAGSWACPAPATGAGRCTWRGPSWQPCAWGKACLHTGMA